MTQNPIAEYNMNPLERKAYWLCQIWLKLCEKVFPDYRYAKLPSGDPRKSTLFKYCYKLAKETEGILTNKDYPLYVLAQFQILKSIDDGHVHSLIEPQILTGDKAWKRWKTWKSKYDKTCLIEENDNKTITETQINIEKEKTKAFLIKHFGKEPTQEQIDENKELIQEWIKKGKISKYYDLKFLS